MFLQSRGRITQPARGSSKGGYGNFGFSVRFDLFVYCLFSRDLCAAPPCRLGRKLATSRGDDQCTQYVAGLVGSRARPASSWPACSVNDVGPCSYRTNPLFALFFVSLFVVRCCGGSLLIFGEGQKGLVSGSFRVIAA